MLWHLQSLLLQHSAVDCSTTSATCSSAVSSPPVNPQPLSSRLHYLITPQPPVLPPFPLPPGQRPQPPALPPILLRPGQLIQPLVVRQNPHADCSTESAICSSTSAAVGIRDLLPLQHPQQRYPPRLLRSPQTEILCLSDHRLFNVSFNLLLHRFFCNVDNLLLSGFLNLSSSDGFF